MYHKHMLENYGKTAAFLFGIVIDEFERTLSINQHCLLSEYDV